MRKLKVLIPVLAMLASILALALPAMGAMTLQVDDNLGECPGAGYMTIQAAVNAAAAGDTIEVCDGTYAENVTINKNLVLRSLNGRAATTIQGISGAGALGAIQVTNNTTAVQIGAAGQGFTVVGIDNGSPGLENAAVYFQGSHSGAQVLDNEIVANGDHGLLTEFGAIISGFVIDGNEFSGQTFLGANPAGNGFTDQFTLPNFPRQLVTMGGGGGGGSTSNVTFTNNLVTGTAGGLNGSGNEQGNTLVTIDANGATITGNTFAGTTTRFATALRVRGPNTSVTDNVFDPTGLGAATGHIFTQYRPNVSITLNRFDNPGTATPYAIQASGGTGETIDGECNWYGAADGATGAGGSGAAVSANIDVDPWSVAPGGPCLGGTLMGDKYVALGTLQAALPTGDDDTDKRFEKAIESIEKSLTPEWWIDDTTLDPKDGKKVFYEEEKAVKELMKVEGSALADQVIDALVAVDGTLAQAAVDAATLAGGDQNDLDKANERLAKAADAIADGDYDKAIEEYKKAWEYAQKSVS